MSSLLDYVESLSREYEEEFERTQSSLPPLSVEQTLIVESFPISNVIVDAVAGSGKTTTILSAAKSVPSKLCLLLTYNTKLCKETEQRIKQHSIDNLHVFTYHGFVSKATRRVAHTDVLFEESFNLPMYAWATYDHLIVDECQDMTPSYFRLVCRIKQTFMTREAKLMVLGDTRQCIFEFKQATPLFLSLADTAFSPMFDGDWQKLTLHESFRCPPKVCNLVNSLMDQELMRPGLGKPRHTEWLVTNVFDASTILTTLQTVLESFESSDVSFGDVFVLSPSLRSDKQPVRCLANVMTHAEIPIYVPTSDEEKLDLDKIAGKVVFSTFHQVKGLERKIVIVYGIDQSYFDFYAKGNSPRVCPNTIYVALTRSLHTLIIVQHNTNQKCAFVDFEKLEKIMDVVDVETYAPRTSEKKPAKDVFSVSELLRFLPVQTLLEARNHYETSTVRQPGTFLSGASVTSGSEQVSEITGIAVTNAFEHLLLSHGNATIDIDHERHIIIGRRQAFAEKRQLSLKQTCVDLIHQFETDESSTRKPMIRSDMFQKFAGEALHAKEETLENILKLSTLFNALSSGYMFKIKQIPSYDWISFDFVRQSNERLCSMFLEGDRITFEKRIQVPRQAALLDCAMFGVVDMMTEDTVFEIKCVDQLKEEHYLQLLLYGFMLFMAERRMRKMILYNVLKDECIEIKTNVDGLLSVARILIQNKLTNKGALSEEEFFVKTRSMIDREMSRGGVIFTPTALETNERMYPAPPIDAFERLLSLPSPS